MPAMLIVQGRGAVGNRAIVRYLGWLSGLLL